MCKYEAEYISNKAAVSSVLAALTAIFEWQEEGGWSMCFWEINSGGYEDKYFLSNLFVLRGLGGLWNSF